MAVKVRCSCGKPLIVKDTAVGKRVRCPACGQVLSVPDFPGDEGGIAVARKAAAPAKPAARPGERTLSRGTAGAAAASTRAYRFAALGFAGLALGVGALLAGLCLYGRSVDVKPEPLLIGGALAGLWMVLGALALIRSRWTIIPLLVFAYLHLLMFFLFITVGGTTGTNLNDQQIFRAIGHGGVFVCIILLAQGHRALSLSWSAAVPRRRPRWQYPVFLGCFLGLLGVQCLLLGMSSTSLRHYENFPGQSQRIESPYLKVEGERVDGRWVWRYIRDDVPVLGLALPRVLFLPLAVALLLGAILLVVRPWRWLAGRPPVPLSQPGE